MKYISKQQTNNKEQKKLIITIIQKFSLLQEGCHLRVSHNSVKTQKDHCIRIRKFIEVKTNI